MILGLIPSRLKSKRLANKALIKIDGLPMIVHVFKRAMLSKKIDKVIVCTDSNQIKSVVEKYGGTAVMTSSKHTNGTERISEVSSKFNAKLVIDIQGDEPLFSPVEADKLISFHLRNLKYDIVLPSMKHKTKINNPNLVKLVKSNSGKILYFSRSSIPFSFQSQPKCYYKHVSIISFKPQKLLEFKKLKTGELEKIEGVELMRALENDFNIGTYVTNSQTYAVDVYKDLESIIQKLPKDRYRKLY